VLICFFCVEHRPQLNDIFQHPFFLCGPIPKSIPQSALVAPPNVFTPSRVAASAAHFNLQSKGSDYPRDNGLSPFLANKENVQNAQTKKMSNEPTTSLSTKICGPTMMASKGDCAESRVSKYSSDKYANQPLQGICFCVVIPKLLADKLQQKP
jgi:hypothetical protein